MATFTFNDTTADRLMNDLGNGKIVRLSKANGASITIQHGNDIDEFGDYIYRFSIEPAEYESSLTNTPVNEMDLISFLEGLEFTNYEILN